MKAKQSGFTLIEMMVVIGIIGILAAVMTGGYTYAVKSAQRAKATEAVSNARAALEILHEKWDGGWPDAVVNPKTRNEQGFAVMDEFVAKLFAKYGLLNVDFYKDEETGNYTLRGVDRCGIADPWAQDVLRNADKNMTGQALLTRAVPSGGTVKDHLIYFAVDKNDDGWVRQDEGAPVRGVRGKVITWCAGADGGLGDCKTDKAGKRSYNGRMVSNHDNVYSWQRAQEER